jgi:hypothetical protein
MAIPSHGRPEADCAEASLAVRNEPPGRAVTATATATTKLRNFMGLP